MKLGRGGRALQSHPHENSIARDCCFSQPSAGALLATSVSATHEVISSTSTKGHLWLGSGDLDWELCPHFATGCPIPYELQSECLGGPLHLLA